MSARQGDTLALELTDHLLEHARRYYPEIAADSCVHIDLIRCSIRKFTRLYVFQLRARELSHRIIVKVPLPETKPYFILEYNALRAIQELFDRLDDSRFGTVRVLDLLGDYSAVVMEEIRHPTLHRLFIRSNRLYRPFKAPVLQAKFRNAGAWLRRFHALPKRHDLEKRLATRATFLESVQRSADCLDKAHGCGRLFGRVAAETAAVARATLPETLPLVTGHIDYAPHNIFVGPEDRVTVIDTLADRRVPKYKDIAYFLLTLKATSAQSYSLGLMFDAKTIAAYESEFIDGYFEDEPFSLTSIRLFEIEAILKKWASRVESYRQASGVLRFAKRCRMTLRDTCYHSYLNQLLREVRGTGGGPPMPSTLEPKEVSRTR